MEVNAKQTVHATGKQASQHAEALIIRALRVGVLASASLILIGLALFLLSGNSGYPGDSYPTRVADIFSGAVALKPFAIISAGLVLLISTPILRVGASIAAFCLEKDWLYAGISAFVFCTLLISFLFGK